MPSVVGQDRGAFATVMRDFVEAEQEDSFPRNKVNKDIFFDNQWDINKERQNAQYLKHSCCMPEQGGQKKSIDCAFNRVYDSISNGGDFIGLPHGGTTGSFRVRQNGFNTRRVSGKR